MALEEWLGTCIHQQCRPLVRNFVGDFWLVSASSEFGENNLKSWHATALSEILSGADDQEGSISAAFGKFDKNYVVNDMIMDIGDEYIYGCVAPDLCMDCAVHIDEFRNKAYDGFLCGRSPSGQNGDSNTIVLPLPRGTPLAFYA